MHTKSFFIVEMETAKGGKFECSRHEWGTGEFTKKKPVLN